MNDVAPWGEIYTRRLGNILPLAAEFDSLARLKAIKALIIDDPANLDAHLGHFQADLDAYRMRYTFSEAEYLEFLPFGGDKGRGLTLLADHLNLNSSEVAAIGDWLNDIEMLDWCGYGCTVANGHDQVRERAKRVFSSNDQGGVAEFLASIV